MNAMTIYHSAYTGNLANCVYQSKVLVADKETMEAVAKKDHVTATYKNDYRGNDNFLESDCVALDCDNDHSDDPGDWISPFEIMLEFEDVPFISVTSRSHMKQKGERSPRPRFHVYFPVGTITDVKKYAKLKKRIAAAYPYFDSNALDAARFLFGNPDAEVEVYEGNITIDDYLDEKAYEEWEEDKSHIHEGSRNSTMSKYAAKVIKRLGDTDEAYQQFLKEAEKCTPPLEQTELDLIWGSARKFWQKISAQEDYVSPENYKSGLQYKPDDFSDIGQAEKAAELYAESVRYSLETDYLVYNGSIWQEDRIKAHAKLQEFTKEQLDEANAELATAMKDLDEGGMLDEVKSLSNKKAEEKFGDDARFKRFISAVAYKQFALKRRDSKYVSAALKEWQPLCAIDVNELDKDEFLLNTPTATYDLRYGWSRPREHSAMDFITKQTNVDPGDKGKDLWQESLDLFFQGDKDLERYVQDICGLAAIGKVYMEAVIISYGSGRNGKSTFWNSISKVLGSYSGGISADALTANCKRNVKPELAETKGKRLLIAAELEESTRLSTSLIKQLCSTDQIQGEKKYKAPIKFEPSHTLILHTNFLPRVGVIDEGTWRRLVVVPFNAVIEGSSDIKNYAQYLVDNAGEAILAWIMEGSKRVIEADFHIEMPDAVSSVTKAYRDRNDWLAQFIDECCVLGDEYKEHSGAVYDEYRSYSIRIGEFARNTAEFYSSIASLGIQRKRTKEGSFLLGIKLKNENLG